MCNLFLCSDSSSMDGQLVHKLMLSMEDFESLRCLKTLLFLNFFQKDLRVELPFLSQHGISASASLSTFFDNNKEKKQKT